MTNVLVRDAGRGFVAFFRVRNINTAAGSALQQIRKLGFNSGCATTIIYGKPDNLDEPASILGAGGFDQSTINSVWTILQWFSDEFGLIWNRQSAQIPGDLISPPQTVIIPSVLVAP